MDFIDKGIGLMIMASIIGAVMTNILAVNTTAWGVPEVALWALVPILIVVAVLKYVTS